MVQSFLNRTLPATRSSDLGPFSVKSQRTKTRLGVQRSGPSYLWFRLHQFLRPLFPLNQFLCFYSSGLLFFQSLFPLHFDFLFTLRKRQISGGFVFPFLNFSYSLGLFTLFCPIFDFIFQRNYISIPPLIRHSPVLLTIGDSTFFPRFISCCAGNIHHSSLSTSDRLPPKDSLLLTSSATKRLNFC